MASDEDDASLPAGPRLTRRQAIGAGAGAAGALALATYGLTRGGGSPGATAASLGPADVVLRPAPSTVELGSKTAETWTFGGALPGRELRLQQGKRVRIRVDNELPEPISVHWHGIRLRNAADGVPGLTQEAIAPGASFMYDFTPPPERCSSSAPASADSASKWPAPWQARCRGASSISSSSRSTRSRRARTSARSIERREGCRPRYVVDDGRGTLSSRLGASGLGSVLVYDRSGRPVGPPTSDAATVQAALRAVR